MLTDNPPSFDRYMFWIDGAGMVGRANMDGTDTLFLVAYGMTSALAIAVDYKSKISSKYMYIAPINI